MKPLMKGNCVVRRVKGRKIVQQRKRCSLAGKVERSTMGRYQLQSPCSGKAGLLLMVKPDQENLVCGVGDCDQFD